ncbi:MAG: hypothetical protein AB2777_21505 [Candidatus Thiodiazotropha endolucinida]
MNLHTEHTINSTLARAKEVAAEHMPAWEGGFASAVVESIEALQAEVKRLQRTADNLQAEIEGTDDITFCDCEATHSIHEITTPCKKCGGVVPGIIMCND